jgi:ATP-binding cassette subfamily F protein 3
VPVEIDEIDNSALKLKFPPSVRSGQYPVIVKDLEKSYGDHLIFKEANVVIERGDKVAFVGKNGEGKSTMIKAIMKEIEINSGSVEVGHNAMIGYFAQNQASLLDENATIFETIDSIAVGEVRTQIKNILGAFMFHGDDVTKKVKVLSGGEKTRLAMIKLLLEPVNLLILDEPSNHLDMKTKDLKDFDGTLILVSHDRDFLDGLATKVFEFGHKRVKEHFEDIKGFLAHKKMESLREIEK